MKIKMPRFKFEVQHALTELLQRTAIRASAACVR